MGIVHDKYIDVRYFIYKNEILENVPENFWSLSCEDIDFNPIQMS